MTATQSLGLVHPTFPSLARLVTTERDLGATVARVSLGLILFPHGAQHNLGWFGGYGFSGTLGWMTGTLGFPAPLAVLGLVTELVAPVLLVLGLGGRATAAAMFVYMGFAASTHLRSGFFMNWFGRLGAGQEGFEYHLLTMALAAVLMLKGMGALSLDRRLFTSARS
ncbi:MAG TPA: DoxX family protein [Polyangiaceae bacterium]|jgi:putative oxidoreductase|nr:DoxX family protein [Polyangiaceae bacterium]